MADNQQENKPPEAPVEKPEYNENTAVLKSSIMIGLIMTDKGPAITSCLHGRGEMIMAKGEIDAHLSMRILRADMRAEQARHNIIPAKGGMINAVRRKLFR